MAASIPIACSLDADDYTTRLDTLRELGRMALIRYQPHPDGAGAVLHFRNTADIGRRLNDVIAAEAKCCAFLDLKLDTKDGTLRLSISGPADAAPVVHDLVSSFESGRILEDQA